MSGGWDQMRVMSEQLTPLEVCERLIGPLPELERICGLRPKALYIWRRPAQGREAGDIVSARYQRALLDWSERHGLGLTARHLVYGASAAELDAILAQRPSVTEAA